MFDFHQIRPHQDSRAMIATRILSISTLVLLLGAFAPSVFSAVDGEAAEKKRDAEARPSLGGEGIVDPHAEEHERLLKDGEENLKEIQRLLDEIKGNLAQKNTGKATQAKQREAVERMNKLVTDLAKGCSKCASGGGGSSGEKKPGSPQSKSGKKPGGEKQKQMSRKQREKMQAQQQRSESGKKEKQDGQTENDRSDTGDPPEAVAGSLPDHLRKLHERWGVLPPRMVEEMMSSGGKEIPAEYRMIYSRYLKRIGEYHERRGR